METRAPSSDFAVKVETPAVKRRPNVSIAPKIVIVDGRASGSKIPSCGGRLVFVALLLRVCRRELCVLFQY